MEIFAIAYSLVGIILTAYLARMGTVQFRLAQRIAQLQERLDMHEESSVEEVGKAA